MPINYTVYGMPIALALHAYTGMSSGWTTEETRALVGVWGKLISRASSMEWRGTAPSMQEPSFLGDPRLRVYNIYGST